MLDSTILIRILQGMLCIGFVITVHELGHLIAARIFGIRVQRFSVFLAPWFSIIRWKPGKYLKFFVSAKEGRRLELQNFHSDLNDFESIKPKSWKDTEYVFGWLPIAGYCRFDTQFYREEFEGGPKIYPHWDIRNLKAWKRLFVTLAGITVNIITAVIIFFCLDFFAPRNDYTQSQDEHTYVSYSPYAKKMGFKDDDIIIKADTYRIRDALIDFKKIIHSKEVTVKRGKDTLAIHIPEYFRDSIIRDVTSKKVNYYFVNYSQYPIVLSVKEGSMADSLGIKKGDLIIVLDSIQVPSINHLFYLGKKKIGKTIQLGYARADKNGQWKYFESTFVMPKGYPIAGMQLAMNKDEYIHVFQYAEDSARNEHNVAQSTLNLTTEVVKSTALSYIPGHDNNKSDSDQQVQNKKDDENKYSGIIGVFRIFPKEWNWQFWWFIVAIFSIGVAIFNLLPIPGLDGGQAIFCLLEIILRRKLNENILDWINGISFLLVLAWIIWSNIKGIMSLF